MLCVSDSFDAEEGKYQSEDFSPEDEEKSREESKKEVAVIISKHSLILVICLRSNSSHLPALPVLSYT